MTGAALKESSSAALSVESSALGKRWVFSPFDPRLAEAISQRHGLPEIVGRILAARGIGIDDVPGFLQPTLRAALPDPSCLTDMDTAAARIAEAIQNRERVAVFGDYDVDGATSSALLARFFRALGQDLRLYIPDRIVEGYGPNPTALKKLKDEGATLAITVDCGATAFDALQSARDAELDIVVLDHHRVESSLPPACALVNPNRLDDASGLGHLAAVGVTFLCIVAVNRLLRARGFYGADRAEPSLMDWLDLVALGTVCDVVPLTGLNRAFVSQGLRVMGARGNAGLAALADVADLSGPCTAFHAGFLLGPRVNAGGRVGEAPLGARLLSTDDPVEARTLAARLHGYNAERKAVEEGVLLQALERAETCLDNAVLAVEGEGWHPGVIGIVAARLKEKYNRPSCVIAFDDNGIGKASGRSVSGIDLGAAVGAARAAGLLIAGGGHAMAAGFTVARDKLEELRAYLNQHVLDQLRGVIYVPELRLDAVVSVPALTEGLVDKVNMLAPYGAGHSEPRFVLSGVKILKPSVVGSNHVSVLIQDTAGGAAVKGIAFRALDTALGEVLLKSGGAPLHLAGHATINLWQGRRSVNFQIVDAAPFF